MSAARPPTRPRIDLPQVVAGVVSVGFVLAVSVALLRGAPDVEAVRLAPSVETTPEPFRVPMASRSDTVVTREARFTVADGALLGRQDELHLIIGNYDARPRIVRGALRIDGSDCLFETPPGRIAQNRPRPFRRTQACAAPDGETGATLTVELRAVTQRQGQLALWVVGLPDGPADDEGPPLLAVHAEGHAFAPSGTRMRARSAITVPRIELLAFMWERPMWQVWLLLGLAWLALVHGAVALASRELPAARRALALGALAAALGATCAVVVPPLQAPDEPDHLLSFAVLHDRPALEAATEDFARRVHFDRIAFSQRERFTPADMEEGYARAWDPREVFSHDVARRATVAAAWWKALGTIVGDRPAAALVTVRLFNAVVFGLAFWVAVLLLARVSSLTAPALALLPLLLIPTLPFFGMHFSEMTWTIGVFVLLAATVLALIDGSRHALLGLAIGVAAAVITAGPRSSWPMAPFVAALLAGRILLAPAAALRGSLAFWLLFAAPAVVLFGAGVLTVPAPFFEQWRVEGLAPPGGISNRTIVLGTLAALGVGLACERGAAWLAPRVSQMRWPAVAMPVGAATAAVWISGTAVASLFVAMPGLPTLEQTSPGMGEYVQQVLAVAATTPRLTSPDHLIWTSFLGGFGWIDTLLPDGVLIALTTIFSAGAVWLLGLVALRRDTVRGAWILLVGVGFAATLALYAATSFAMHRNLHGRYLLGAYVIALAVAGFAPALTAARDSIAVRTTAILTGILAVHATSLLVILARYFG